MTFNTTDNVLIQYLKNLLVHCDCTHLCLLKWVFITAITCAIQWSVVQTVTERQFHFLVNPIF